MTNFLKYYSIGIVVLSLNLKKKYILCIVFLYSYEGLEIAILANLKQITCDIFCAFNA